MDDHRCKAIPGPIDGPGFVRGSPKNRHAGTGLQAHEFGQGSAARSAHSLQWVDEPLRSVDVNVHDERFEDSRRGTPRLNEAISLGVVLANQACDRAGAGEYERVPVHDLAEHLLHRTQQYQPARIGLAEA